MIKGKEIKKKIVEIKKDDSSEDDKEEGENEDRTILQIEDLIESKDDFSIAPKDVPHAQMASANADKLGNTMLESVPVERSWDGLDLEDAVGGVENTEENFTTDYLKMSKGDDLYGSSSGSGADFYNSSGDDMYNRNGDKEKDSGYEFGKTEVKGFGEFEDERRGGRSTLERAGFEDKERQEKRKVRGML